MNQDPIFQQIVEICHRASQGDLEARIAGLNDHPEWGPLVRAINHQLDVTDSFVRESAAAMTHCSRGEFHRPILLRGLPGAFRSAALVINKAAVGMKESHETLQAIARMSEETTQSTHAVAAASEELNVSSSEIARQTRANMDRAAASAAQSHQAVEALQSVKNAFAEIETLRTFIRSIAEKTNLLAFNASIEAARAGSAGTRFSVVAGEVKKLATDTSGATDRIRQQVESMRQALDQTAGFIENLGTELNKLRDAAGAIASITQEQVAATSEISQRMSQISKNSEQVSGRIQEILH